MKRAKSHYPTAAGPPRQRHPNASSQGLPRASASSTLANEAAAHESAFGHHSGNANAAAQPLRRTHADRDVSGSKQVGHAHSRIFAEAQRRRGRHLHRHDGTRGETTAAHTSNTKPTVSTSQWKSPCKLKLCMHPIWKDLVAATRVHKQTSTTTSSTPATSSSSSTGRQAMPPALPGFYYDPVKQRYFVLPPGGAPPTLPVQEAQHLQRQRDADHDKHREANLLSNQPDCMTSLGSLHRPLISNRTKKCNMATRTALREVLDPSGMRSRALNVVPERSQPASLLKSVACRRRSATCSENSNNRYHAVQFAPSCEGDAGDTLLAVGVGNRLALWMLNWRGQTAGIPDTQDNHFEDIRQAEWLLPGKHAGSHEHHTTEPSDYFLPFTTELYNANSSFSPVSCIRWSPAALGLRQSTSMDETCDYNASHTSRTAATHVNRQTNNEAVHEALARSQLSHGMDLFAWCCPGIDVEIAMCNRSRVSISTQMSGAVQLSRPLMSIARLIFFDEQSDWPTVSMSKQLHAGAALSLDYDRHFVPRMLVGGGQGIYVVDLTRNSVWTKMNDTDGVDVAILQSEPQMPSSLYAGLTTEGVVRLYDMRSGKFQRICAIGGRICGLKALDRGQNQLLVASNNGTFGLWDARMPRHSICEYQEHVNTHLPLEIATDPCEAIVASGGEDGRVRIWDIDSGRLVKTLERSDTGIVDRISIGSTSFGEPLLVTASSSGLELFAC